MSVARLGQDDSLITAATAQVHDGDWLRKHLAPGLALADETADWSTQILTGPKARDILAACSDADLAKGWLTHQMAHIAGAEVRLMRVSFAGELGWEIHSKVADTAKVWDAVMAAGAPLGLKPFGMFALLLADREGIPRVEGRVPPITPSCRAGWKRLVDWSKPDFRGKSALEAEKQRGVTKRFCTLVIEAGEQDPPYMSTIWHDGRVVGEATSGYCGPPGSAPASALACCGPI